MRITFCTTDGWDAINGINVWLIQFLPALRARGHDVRVLLFPWSRPQICTALPALRAAGVPTEVVFPPRYTEGAVRACLRHTRAFQPQAFVANMVTPALFAAGWIRAAGIPTVGVIHNDDEEYRAKASLFAGPDPFFRLSALVAISSGLLRVVENASTDLPPRCIHYGLRLPSRHATWSGRPPLRLLYHGRIVQQQKRVLDTIAACVALCHQMPGIEADFIGSGSDSAAASAALHRDNAGGRVRLLARLEPAQITEVLPDYQVAILFSDYEGLGLSILEAMASGLVPICSYTASGLPDIIEHEHNGLFVKDSGEAFHAAVQLLLEQPQTWNRLSHAARETVASRFSLEASLVAWEDLFAELNRAGHVPLEITQPWRITLPPVADALRKEDNRYPGLLRFLWRRVRFPSRS